MANSQRKCHLIYVYNVHMTEWENGKTVAECVLDSYVNSHIYVQKVNKSNFTFVERTFPLRETKKQINLIYQKRSENF